MHHPPLRMMKTKKQTNHKYKNEKGPTDLSVRWVSQQWVGPRPPAPPWVGMMTVLTPSSEKLHHSMYRFQFSVFNIQFVKFLFYFLIAASFAFPNLYMICYRKLNLKSKKWVMMSCETFFLTYDFSKCETFCFFWKLI